MSFGGAHDPSRGCFPHLFSKEIFGFIILVSRKGRGFAFDSRARKRGRTGLNEGTRPPPLVAASTARRWLEVEFARGNHMVRSIDLTEEPRKRTREEQAAIDEAKRRAPRVPGVASTRKPKTPMTDRFAAGKHGTMEEIRAGRQSTLKFSVNLGTSFTRAATSQVNNLTARFLCVHACP
jgi:hypothetical protein